MSRHLVTTRATPTVCGRCRALVLIGITEGLPARVDPEPLNRAGHVAALIARRWVYRLQYGELVQVDADRIHNARIRGPTLVEHKCRDSLHPAYRQITPPPTRSHATEGIPY